MKLRIVDCGRLALLLFLQIACLAGADTNNSWQVVASGGSQNTTDGTVYLSGTIGQAAPALPVSTGDPGRFFAGFWVPGLMNRDGDISMPWLTPSGLHLAVRTSNDLILIDYTIPNGSGRLTMYDIIGAQVGNWVLNTPQAEVALHQWSYRDQVYLLKLECSTGQKFDRLINFRR